MTEPTKALLHSKLYARPSAVPLAVSLLQEAGALEIRHANTPGERAEYYGVPIQFMVPDRPTAARILEVGTALTAVGAIPDDGAVFTLAGRITLQRAAS